MLAFAASAPMTAMDLIPPGSRGSTFAFFRRTTPSSPIWRERAPCSASGSGDTATGVSNRPSRNIDFTMRRALPSTIDAATSPRFTALNSSHPKYLPNASS